MGSKNKLKRFIENESFHNVIQPSPASAAVIAAMKPAAPPPTTNRSTSVSGSEDKGNAVVAVALARWSGSVIEHVALVTTATAAVVFRSGNDQFEIYFRRNRTLQGLPETGRAKVEDGASNSQVAMLAQPGTNWGRRESSLKKKTSNACRKSRVRVRGVSSPKHISSDRDS